MTIINSTNMNPNHKVARNVVQSTKKLNNMYEMVSSGTTASKWSELPAHQIALVHELNDNISKSTGNLDIYHQKSAILMARIDKLTEIKDVIGNAANTILKYKNTMYAKVMPIDDLIDGFLDELQLLLNFSYNGEYLFSGLKVNVKPIDDIVNVANVADDGCYTDIYYRGDFNGRYINAGDELIQKAIAAMHIAKKPSRENLDTAYEWLKESCDDIVQNIMVLSYEASNIADKIDEKEKFITFLEGQKSDLMALDLPTTMLRLNEEYTIINATFMAASKSMISLADYL